MGSKMHVGTFFIYTGTLYPFCVFLFDFLHFATSDILTEVWYNGP